MKTIVAIFFLLSVSLVQGHELKVVQGNHFSLWGKREFTLYIPKSPKAVVVALHGCMQKGTEFVEGSNFLKYAEEYGIAILAPEQDALSNKYHCWNWFYAYNQMRSGEAASIASLLTHVKITHGLNKLPNFVVGMSAGGAMASIMANVYPEMFKAMATHHGLQYKATESPFDAEDVTYNGASTPAIWAATKAFALAGGIYNTPNKMPAIIFYGSTQDEVMNPIHAEQIEKELLYYNDLLDNAFIDGSTRLKRTVTKNTPPNLYASTVIKHRTDKITLIERHMIDTLGHAWSGGNSDFPFNDSLGPDATKLILNFFKQFMGASN